MLLEFAEKGAKGSEVLVLACVALAEAEESFVDEGPALAVLSLELG